MKGNVFDKIRKTSIKYQGYALDCYDIANEARKHIDWSDIVSCEYYHGEGICIMIDENVCNAATFFELVEESKNGMVDKETFIRNCI